MTEKSQKEKVPRQRWFGFTLSWRNLFQKVPYLSQQTRSPPALQVYPLVFVFKAPRTCSYENFVVSSPREDRMRMHAAENQRGKAPDSSVGKWAPERNSNKTVHDINSAFPLLPMLMNTSYSADFRHPILTACRVALGGLSIVT